MRKILNISLQEFDHIAGINPLPPKVVDQRFIKMYEKIYIQTRDRDQARIVLARMLAFFYPSLLYWNSTSLFLTLHIFQVLIITIAFQDVELALIGYAIFSIVINSLYSVIRKYK